AIERGDMRDLKDELGDLLLQVVYHAQMAREVGAFDFNDVTGAICDKMTRRHPHVFGDESVATAEEQTEAWEELKQEEAAERGRKNVLDGISIALPALVRAKKIGRRAGRVGFDWPDRTGPRQKISEELGELDAAIGENDRAAVAAEMGDLLFAVVNLCRHLELDPEACLRGANHRFERRFRFVEANVDKSGGEWGDFDLDQLEALWQAAKLETEEN
ncbi:MAG: nucleoside triphosphate pyrophosphohydrolase, partial [Gammaproteobacteria bacterium]